MPLLIRMTSTTGNKLSLRRRFPLLYSSRAFTFIEIMITLAILSAGIVVVYRSFFLCFNGMRHISHRWEAHQFIEEKFDILEQQLRQEGPDSFNLGHLSEWQQIDGYKTRFDYKLNVHEIENVVGVWIADIDLSWKEGARTVTLHREAAISNHKGI